MRYCTYLSLIALIFMPALITACGSGSSSPQQAAYESVLTANYKVAYIPDAPATDGTSTFKIRVSNRTTGVPVTGKTISLTPTMHMTSMNHATPFETLQDKGDGTYSGAVYYLMASKMADGTSMGTWELKFAIDGETAVFNPAVSMSMGTTSKAALKGIVDTIGSMTGTATARTYHLFNDGISGTGVKLFIAAADDAMMTSFPAVSVGAALHDQAGGDWPVTSMTVEASTDKAAWTALNDDGNGHWSKAGLQTLSPGAHLYIRLMVNGEQKTTDGSAAGTSNAYGDFTVGGM